MNSLVKAVILLILTIKTPITWAENNGNVYLDKTGEKYRQLISIINPKMFKAPACCYDSSWLEDSKMYYRDALGFYNQKEYEKAIDNYIRACRDYNCFGIVYYQLGLCLMDASIFSGILSL